MKTAAEAFTRLVEIIARLRDPVSGCPWDKEQTHESLKPYLIEEAFEAIDAIDAQDTKELEGELGDVLLQVVLHGQIASETSSFSSSSICERLSDKLVRRHPHVFGTVSADTSAQVLKNWEKIKSEERKEVKGTISGIPASMPGLLKAQRLGEKTARVGFDWKDTVGVLEKVNEELKELNEAESEAHKFEEFGDLLFTLVQWGRHHKIDAEESMRAACKKFSARFNAVEELAKRPLTELAAVELEALWTQVKAKAK